MKIDFFSGDRKLITPQHSYLLRRANSVVELMQHYKIEFKVVDTIIGWDFIWFDSWSFSWVSKVRLVRWMKLMEEFKRRDWYKSEEEILEMLQYLYGLREFKFPSRKLEALAEILYLLFHWTSVIYGVKESDGYIEVHWDDYRKAFTVSTQRGIVAFSAYHLQDPEEERIPFQSRVKVSFPISWWKNA